MPHTHVARIVDYGHDRDDDGDDTDDGSDNGTDDGTHVQDDGGSRCAGELLALGFSLQLDFSQRQSEESSCGVVAAAVAHILWAKPDDWPTADVSYAADPSLVPHACALLDLPMDCPIPPLCTSQVEALLHARGCPSVRVLPVDKLIQQVRCDVQAQTPVTRVCVMNTEPSGQRGRHWLTVIYSV